MTAAPSLNTLTAQLVQALVADASALRVGVSRSEAGCLIIDAGIAHQGGLEAGRRIAEVCLGGLGKVSLVPGDGDRPLQVAVHTAQPVLACLGSQYAGWSLNHGEGKGAFRALGSGPARALAQKESLFGELGYRDIAPSATLVLEVDREPPPEVQDKVARDCGVAPDAVTFILTPTHSLAGVVQIVARVLEVAMHKVHALHFPLERIVDGAGYAPIPAPAKDFLTAMGRTNDAILFGGVVQLFVDASDDEARELARQLPASASRDYGKPFARIFKDVGYDFYKIDPMLFAPARVVVSCTGSGASFRAGRMDAPMLATALGGESV